jgi:hypothetical protein
MKDIPDINDLPELTPEERAAMDRITPDFIERCFREVSAGIRARENEAERIDAIAHEFATGTEQSIDPLDVRDLARRHVDLLATFAGLKRSLLEKWKRAYRAEKQIREYDELLSEEVSPLTVAGTRWHESVGGANIPMMRGSPSLPKFVAFLHQSAAELEAKNAKLLAACKAVLPGMRSAVAAGLFGFTEDHLGEVVENHVLVKQLADAISAAETNNEVQPTTQGEL